MKIIPGKYKEEPNWQKWIKFRYAHGSQLSVVFLRRLAALARDMGKAMEYTYGYRPIEETQRLYAADVMKYGKPSGKVALPGHSWHEHGLAVDLSGAFWESLSNTMWVPKSRLKQNLNTYGLMLPLNKVDSPSVVEWWHIQPIETNGVSGSLRASFLDPDDEVYGKDDTMDVKAFQKAFGLVADGIAGPKTKAKAVEVYPLIQTILQIPDAVKLKTENDQLKNDMRIINGAAVKWIK